LRRIVKMPQSLVAPGSMRVVVGVALQMKQHPVRHHMVAVPRVARLASLKMTIALLQAQQSIMLHIIGRGELEIGPQRRGQQERQDLPT
jgi:hypothetical protein